MCPSTFWFHVVIGAAVSNRIQPEEELGCPAQQKKQPGRNQHQPRDRFWFSESLGGISKVWLLVFALSSSSKLTVTSRPLSFSLCRTSVFLFCCCSVAAEINDCILHSSISGKKKNLKSYIIIIFFHREKRLVRNLPYDVLHSLSHSMYVCKSSMLLLIAALTFCDSETSFRPLGLNVVDLDYPPLSAGSYKVLTFNSEKFPAAYKKQKTIHVGMCVYAGSSFRPEA